MPTPPKTKQKKPQQKMINLALQGGGAHGAFTWGVLDYLLQDGRVGIEAITATSAGAMNACALAYGMTEGGPERAREILDLFWRRISETGALFGPVHRSPAENAYGLNPFMQNWNMDHSVSHAMFEAMTGVFSPYQFNPLNYNPLREILADIIDFKAIKKCDCLKLFVCATNVRTGDARIFNTHEITIDTILASAALPFLFQAVEIDGQAYWDGGYLGNPSLWPLFYEAKSRDILLVHINAITSKNIPKTAADIHDRLNEITFNSALLKELRAIYFVQKLIKDDMLKSAYHKKYKNMLFHAIRADRALDGLGAASKLDTDWNFLLHLKDLGRKEAKKWLAKTYPKLGIEASVSIERDYLKTS
jgi:NTE family protein